MVGMQQLGIYRDGGPVHHITPHAHKGAVTSLWGRAHHTASPGESTTIK